MNANARRSKTGKQTPALVSEYLASIGSKGGKVSRRALTTAQARAMVIHREAKRRKGIQGVSPNVKGERFGKTAIPSVVRRCDDWTDAFAICREMDKPINVAVPVNGFVEIARIFPSGRCEHVCYEPPNDQACLQTPENEVMSTEIVMPTESRTIVDNSQLKFGHPNRSGLPSGGGGTTGKVKKNAMQHEGP